MAGRRGSAGQWFVAVVAIAATGALVFWIISNRPAPPQYDDLRISVIETPPPPPRGPRLVVDTPDGRKVRGLEEASFVIAPGESLAPGLPPGEGEATLVVPIRIDTPIEASLHVEFVDMDIEVIHDETVLGRGEDTGQGATLTTERLPFPVGTFDFQVRCTLTGPAPRAAVTWIVEEGAAPEAIPTPG